MPPKKNSSLVVVPAPPTAVLPGSDSNGRKATPRKKPSDPREFPAARDARGTASREEIRREMPRRTAPRQAPARRPGRTGRAD